jgi:hypothetical protein
MDIFKFVLEKVRLYQKFMLEKAFQKVDVADVVITATDNRNAQEPYLNSHKSPVSLRDFEFQMSHRVPLVVSFSSIYTLH